eukprot:jgi/Undpi1/11751/HiC_scaffold_37.g14046.m1
MQKLALVLPLVLAATAVAQSQKTGWLGVYLADGNAPVVAEVIPGSPAAKAGLKARDRFLAVDRDKTASTESFVAAIRRHGPGDRVTLRLRRGDREVVTKVKLGERPATEASPPAQGQNKGKAPKDTPRPAGDIAVPQNPVKSGPKGRPYLGVALKEGSDVLEVTRVIDGSPAQAAGLKIGDRIVRWGRKRARNLDELDKILGSMAAGDRSFIELRRGDDLVSLPVRFGRAPGRRGAAGREVVEERPTIRTKPAKQPKPAKEGKPVKEAKPAKQGKPAANKLPSNFGTSLAKAMKAKGPVLAVFGSEWSPSCQAFKKSLASKDVAKGLRGFTCVWVDTEKNPDAAKKYGLKGLPHTLILEGGKAKYERSGFLSGKQMAKVLARYRAGERDGGRRTKPAARTAEDAQMQALQTRMEAVAKRLRKVEEARDEEIERLRKEIAELRAMLKKLKR